MKIAIGAGFFAEGDVDVNSGHLTKVRYKNDFCTEEISLLRDHCYPSFFMILLPLTWIFRVLLNNVAKKDYVFWRL